MQHAEHGEGFGRGFTPASRRRQQRAAGLEFGQEPGDPLLLIHRAIGHRQLQVAAEFVDGVAVTSALLANVEAGQAEGEDVHLAEQFAQGFAAQTGGHQAVAHQFEVGAELFGGAVVKVRTAGCGGEVARVEGEAAAAALEGGLPARLVEVLVARKGESQPLQHIAELEPVGLQPVARCPLLVDLRKAQPVHLQGFEQGGAHLAPLHRDAELITQQLHRFHIALQHQLPLIAGGAPGDLRGHRGVAVSVGAHPGAEGAEVIQGGLHIGVAGGQGRADALLQLRHRIEEHLLEVVERVIHLIEHRGFELVQFVGAPPEADLLFQLLAVSFACFAAATTALFQLLDQRGHAALLVAHGVAHDLGGVGREHQPDVEFAQQVLDLGRWHPQGPQPLEQLPEGGRFALAGEGRQEGIVDAGGGAGLETRQVAVFLDVLLEDVDQLEIERKGTGRCDPIGQIHGVDHRHDRLAGSAGEARRFLIGFDLGGREGPAQFLQADQAFHLGRWTFASQHREPKVLDQFKPFLQQPPHRGGNFGGGGSGRRGSGYRQRPRRWGRCGWRWGGRPHGQRESIGAIHDHPKAWAGSVARHASRAISRASRAAASAATISPTGWPVR